MCAQFVECATALEETFEYRNPLPSTHTTSVLVDWPAASLNAIIQFYDSRLESENHKEKYEKIFYWLPIRRSISNTLVQLISSIAVAVTMAADFIFLARVCTSHSTDSADDYTITCRCDL